MLKPVTIGTNTNADVAQGVVTVDGTGFLGGLAAAIGGLIISGNHNVHKLVGLNGSNTSYWLMLFDATSTPANNAVPKAQRYVGFGISSSYTISELDLGVRQVIVATGVFLAWSSTPNVFTPIASATNLYAEAWGL